MGAHFGESIVKSMMLGDEDFDPYGKDLPPLGSGGKEPTYRIQDGTLVRLTDEEYAAKLRPQKKPKTNKRGNKWL